MKRVVIIGAGPAGLTAASEFLKHKEYEVIILEETDDIGGLSKTVKYNGNRMDIGGHRFFSKNEMIKDYWKKIMPLQSMPSYDDKVLKRQKKLDSNGLDPEKEDKVMLLRNRYSRIYFENKFYDYPLSLKKETFTNIGFKRTVKSGLSYIKAKIIKKKENSLEDFYINRFGKELYSIFFEKYTEKLWLRHPSKISADWGAQRVKGLSVSSVLKDMIVKKLGKKQNEKTETSLIEEFWYPKYGPGQLWETMAENIVNNGGIIKKRHKVVEINIEDKTVKSVVCDVDGKKEKIEADIFISSMPLKDLVASFKGICLPNNINEIANGLPYIDFQTVGVLVKKLNIVNTKNIRTLNNIIPDCWIYVQDPSVKMLRFQIFNNWSPYLVAKPNDTVFLGLEYTCIENDEFWNMSDSKFCEFAVDELEKIGVISKENVIDVHREKVKKAYPAYFDTYSRIDELVSYLNEFQNLYCIGRNGQHRYNNMDHSMLTAIETVNNISSGVETRDNIWSVNTEKSYHEGKN